MKSFINRIIEWFKADYWRSLFVVLMAVLLFVVPRMASDAGMSGDEHFHAKHAADVYEFYKTFGKDTVATTYTESNNLPTYGQFVDNLSYAIYRWIGSDDEMAVRHIVNSIFGWLAILFTALIGYRISKKWFAAIVIMLLMFFSPRFLGHSFNNLKDLNLATAMIMGLYYIIVFLEDFPKVKKSTMVMLAISIGFAIAVRIGGLLLIAYFGLFCAVLFIKNYKLSGIWTKPNNALFLKMLKWGLIIVIGGYIIGMLLWPFGLVKPIANPKFVLSYMSQFSTSLRQNFEGAMIWSDLIPWYYTPKYILMTIPVAVILGMVIYPFFGAFKKSKWFESFVLIFAFVFPVFWLTYTEANVYGGWRHSVFAYPPMVAFAGLGFTALIEWIVKKTVKDNSVKKTSLIYGLGILGILILLFGPIRHTIRNHPYEYVYFNELVGGIDGAYGNYELDYYYHSTREATEWVIANAEKSGLETTDKIKVATWHQASVGYYLRNDTAKFENVFSRWQERGNNDWDYAIFAITGISPALLKNTAAFPPVNTVYEIKVDDKPICIVLKRTDKSDYYGNIYKNRNQIDSALILLKQSLNIIPTDESVLLNLSEIYLNQRQFDSADYYLNTLLSVDDLNENAYYFRAYSRMFQNRLDEAQKDLQFIINYNPKNTAALWLSSNIYASQGNLIMLEKTLEKYLIQNPQQQQQAFDLLKQVYPQLGLSVEDAQRAFARIWTKVLEKLGYKEEAKQMKRQRF